MLLVAQLVSNFGATIKNHRGLDINRSHSYYVFPWGKMLVLK